MPPVFKKAKDYDPQLASKTLKGPETNKPEADNRQLLIDLGLADGTDSEGEADDSNEHYKAAAAEEDEQQQGSISAYYPNRSNPGAAGGVTKAVDKLRARLENALTRLQAGKLDDGSAQEVQELLYDQQRQIDVLMRGQFSLKGSVESMRRESREIESRNQDLQQQLEEQHNAALKEMEGKLERAILQVQQLQLATRERQHQQEACSQMSLQAANQEAAQAKAKVSELQALLTIKDSALVTAQQRADQLASEIARVSATSQHLEQDRRDQQQQHAEVTRELKQLAEACQTAEQQNQTASAALKQAEQAIDDLKQQLQSAVAAQQALQSELEVAQASSRQQQAASHAELAAREQELTSRCKHLEKQLQETTAALQKQAENTSAQAAAEKQQSAEQRTELEQQLLHLRAAKAELESRALASEVKQKQLSEKLDRLQQELAQSAETQSELDTEKQHAQQQLAALTQKQMAAASSNEQLLQQQSALQDQVQQLTADRESLAQQLQQAREQATGMQEQLQNAVKQQAEAQNKLSTMDENAKKLQSRISVMQSEHQKAERLAADQIKQLQEALNLARSHIESAQEAADKKVAEIQAAAAREVDEHRRKWREEFEKRRKLHNLVIELKGNIRVLARVRPMIEKEFASSGGGDDGQAVRVVDEETVTVNGPTTREYQFDRVFAPSDGQEQVYQEVSPLVTSTLDGFNVCIMAYGQTGSGKTYTIEGPGSNPGVNSRALAELFQMASERTGEVSYQFSASVLEIYNEQIFDLLAGSRDTGEKMDIKEGPQGLFIPGLRIEPVMKADDVTNVLQKGKQNRSTFATNMNEHSSRSHLVLTVYVKGQDLAKGTTWSAKLHLIDLAGSERVSRSGAEGERLKEAAAINKSLSALGDVVAALQQRSSHIPFRNSKLTRLLEDSLGGNSKTLMIVNCSPASENAGESKCSLEFAARARKVELGAATRNIDSRPSSPATTDGGAGSTGGSLRASQMSPLRTGSPGDSGTHSAGGSPRVSRNLGDSLGSTSRLANSRRAGTPQ